MICSHFSRFYENLPYKPYCADDLSFGLKVLPKELAVTKRYLQLNPPQLTKYLCFDIDKDVLSMLDELVLPAPNIITLNRPIPRNGGPVKGHVLYELASPVNTGPKGREKPVSLMKLVKAGLESFMGADPGYSGLITKNPLHGGFNGILQHNKTWELLELLDWIPDHHLKYKMNHTRVDLQGGRNCGLFDSVRSYAYSQVQHFRSIAGKQEFHATVLACATQHNQLLPIPLPQREVDSIANSVAKWTWGKYTGGRRNSGVLTQAQLLLPAKERQSIGARYTNEKRSSNTLERLTSARDSLRISGHSLTQAKLAASSGLSLRTVKRYWDRLVE